MGHSIDMPLFIRKHLRMLSIRRSQQASPHPLIEDPEKQEAIETSLISFLTTSITLRPRIGELIYFEHEFSNSSNVSVSVGLYWNDDNLRYGIITMVHSIIITIIVEF